MNNEVRSILVTVGRPDGFLPISNKVCMFVFKGETPIKIAKKFRKQAAFVLDDFAKLRGLTRIKPSDLYWEIYEKVDDTTPILSSENSPSRMK